MSLIFPSDFKFGASTSSYQIEGNHSAEGSGKNIWSEFCKKQGAVYQKHNGDLACDHFNRYKEDIQIMADLGLDSYRFSISWARIFPNGTGVPNQAGLDFYNRLVDTLLENNITPMITLYHWDLPVKLQQTGGWADDNIPRYFSDYAKTMVNSLGNRVTNWITLNEPWVFMHLGYVNGLHAPGIKNLDMASRAYKNIVLAHSYALRSMRSESKKLNIGMCCNYTVYEPYSDTSADTETTKCYASYQNDIFSDAWAFGSIPKIAKDVFNISDKNLNKDDLYVLQNEKSDFLGLNYYTRFIVKHNTDHFLNAELLTHGDNTTDMGWEVYPDGLRQMILYTHNRYELPISVTENGCAFDDPIINNTVADSKRCNYLSEHLKACLQAIQEGANVQEYYAWSLLDNFEWAFGYAKRFGIIHVDFDTQKRTPKNSAILYKKLIKANKKAHHNQSSVHS